MRHMYVGWSQFRAYNHSVSSLWVEWLMFSNFSSVLVDSSEAVGVVWFFIRASIHQFSCV